MAEPEAVVKEDGTHEADLEQMAAYKHQRDGAVRQAFAYKTILASHGIDIAEVTEDRLNTLPIRAGVVDGVYNYTPPKPPPKDPPAPSPTAGGAGKGALTLDDVHKMSRDQINNDWENVSAVLAASA